MRRARLNPVYLTCAVIAMALACADSPQAPSGDDPKIDDSGNAPPVRPFSDYVLYFNANPDGHPLGVALKEIYSIRADGSGQQKLTDWGTDLSIAEFSVSADGRRLAYESEYEPGCGHRPNSRPCAQGEAVEIGVDLVVIGTDGTGRTRLTDGLTAYPLPLTAVFADPHWSPDGNRLVYTAMLPSGWTIHTLEVASGADHSVATSPFSWSPRWAPTGDRIAHLSRTPSNTWELDLIAADGANRSVITSLPMGNAPSWAPDGTQLAITVVGLTSEYHVETIGADGHDRRGISGTLRNAANPYWDPAGRSVVFQAEYQQGSAIFRVDLPDGEPQPIATFTPGYEASLPVVSPDGGIVAFILSRPSGLTELWVVRMDGSDLQRVTPLTPVFQVAFDPRVPAS